MIGVVNIILSWLFFALILAIVLALASGLSGTWDLLVASKSLETLPVHQDRRLAGIESRLLEMPLDHHVL